MQNSLFQSRTRVQLLTILFMTSLLVAPQIAHAVELKYPPVVGLGNKACSSWPVESANGDIASNAYAQWVLGVASGKNLFDPPKKGSIYLPYDEENIVEYIDRNCSLHPEKFISEVAYEFFAR